MCVATLFAASGTLPPTLDPTTGLQLSSSSPAVGGPPPQAGTYLGRASSPAPLPQPQVYVSVHNAPPSFEQMEIVHHKKIPGCRVRHGGVVSNKSQYPRGLPCGILHTTSCSSAVHCTSCYVMGGQKQSVVDKGQIVVSDVGTDFFESDNASAQDEVASSICTATMDSSGHIAMTKKAWPKLENGLFLLLNFVASIRLPSSTSLPPHGSSNPLPHSPSGPGYQSNQSSISGTFKSSTSPSNMDSETTGLSTVQLVEHPSCHDCRENVTTNATVYWWDGSSDPLPRTFPVESTAAMKLTGIPSFRNPSLDLRASGRGSFNSTLHCSGGEAVTMETTTTARCVRTSRYRESEIVNSPKLSSGQLAVDLHWQNGGTGGTVHSYVHHFNSTPLDFMAPGELTKTKFTIAENLLLYANSLLMMAF